jgi:hypothetical protein
MNPNMYPNDPPVPVGTPFQTDFGPIRGVPTKVTRPPARRASLTDEPVRQLPAGYDEQASPYWVAPDLREAYMRCVIAPERIEYFRNLDGDQAVHRDLCVAAGSLLLREQAQAERERNRVCDDCGFTSPKPLRYQSFGRRRCPACHQLLPLLDHALETDDNGVTRLEALVAKMGFTLADAGQPAGAQETDAAAAPGSGSAGRRRLWRGGSPE